jgi:16S rRNA (cytosine1402-N4)-methyltransferase
MALTAHIPVMPDEVTWALRPVAGGRYCDGTLGGGGHARRILEQSAPDGQLLGLDRDGQALERTRESLAEFGPRARLRQANFADAVQVLEEEGMVPVDGLLLDLGISSDQLKSEERGFGLMSDGPLDMRMDTSSGATAAELVDELSEQELARVLRDYGEEPAARRLARAIKQARGRGELDGTADLRRVVSQVLGGRGPRSGKIHPATRVFQALRIAVNDELGSLERFLQSFRRALRPGGRVAVIAFHSLEDRLVKRSFARLERPCICPPDLPVCACGRSPQLRALSRKPLRPSEDEVAANPRARSARLRAAEAI